jgi:hypothetical protein
MGCVLRGVDDCCLLYLAQPRLLFQVRMSTEGDPESLDPAGNVGHFGDPMGTWGSYGNCGILVNVGSAGNLGEHAPVSSLLTCVHHDRPR